MSSCPSVAVGTTLREEATSTKPFGVGNTGAASLRKAVSRPMRFFAFWSEVDVSFRDFHLSLLGLVKFRTEAR